MTSTATPAAKFFTPEDANRMLPYVRSITRDIVAMFNDVHERRHRLDRLRMDRPPGEDDDPYEMELRQSERELIADINTLDGVIGELHDLGVQLKDPVRGLVDFPSLRDGREVSLCWMLGEETVAHWHEIDGGFGGRHEISTD